MDPIISSRKVINHMLLLYVIFAEQLADRSRLYTGCAYLPGAHQRTFEDPRTCKSCLNMFGFSGLWSFGNCEIKVFGSYGWIWLVVQVRFKNDAHPVVPSCSVSYRHSSFVPLGRPTIGVSPVLLFLSHWQPRATAHEEGRSCCSGSLVEVATVQQYL